MRDTDRITFNTGVLYTKMVISTIITLYTTRLVIKALGIEDFGVFNLVAGVIAMLSFLNTAMTISTQRYLSFYHGKKDISMQIRIFNNSFLLHLVIAVLLTISLLSITNILFYNFLNISISTIQSAIKVYQFMIVTVFFSILSVPFIASLNAHENMVLISIIGILEVLLKLMIVIVLLRIDDNRLVYYSLMTTVVGIIVFLLYAFLSHKMCKEVKINMSKYYNLDLMRELGSFAGWNFFGAACSVGRTQGLGIILNLFYGTAINAAYGISNQISGQLNLFSSLMIRAINPQIMKSEGANQRERMLNLSLFACKYGVLLLAFIAIPSIFEINTILDLWLTEVPEYTSIFSILVLIAIMLNQITIGLQSALQATGNIKFYQILVGSTLLFNLPVAFILLNSGFPIYSVIISYMLFEIIASFIRLILLKRIAGLSLRQFLDNVLYKITIPILTSIFICYLINYFYIYNYRIIFTFTLSIFSFFIAVYFTSLNYSEKSLVKDLFHKVKRIEIWKILNRD